MTTYFRDRYQGVGAIAAASPAPRSAPAPSLGGGATFAQDARWGDPMLNLPRRSRLGRNKRVLAAGPGGTVLVRGASLRRPAVMMSGLRSRPGMAGLGLDDQGAGMHTSPNRLKARGAALRASVAGMKPAAYVPPVAQIGAFATYSPLTRQPSSGTPQVQIFPVGPPPRIGTGIGQRDGTVTVAEPSPYGPGVGSPVVSVGGGVAISPVLEEYEPPINVGAQGPIDPLVVSVAQPASGMSTRTWLLLGSGAALALYLLTRKRKNR